MAKEKTWIDEIPTVPCRGCEKPMYFVTGRKTGKEVPADPRAMVLVVFKPMPMQPLQGISGKDFLDQVHEIVLKNGDRVRGEDLRLMVSHFATCPKASHFSGSNR